MNLGDAASPRLGSQGRRIGSSRPPLPPATPTLVEPSGEVTDCGELHTRICQWAGDKRGRSGGNSPSGVPVSRSASVPTATPHPFRSLRVEELALPDRPPFHETAAVVPRGPPTVEDVVLGAPRKLRAVERHLRGGIFLSKDGLTMRVCGPDVGGMPEGDEAFEPAFPSESTVAQATLSVWQVVPTHVGDGSELPKPDGRGRCA
jgi:hypothetical protein